MKEYLSDDQLLGFENYKYSCKDTSPLSIHVMHPFWNKVVEYCPKRIAPNVLTFVGFLFTFLTFFMFTWMDYSFYASDPDHPEVPSLPNWSFILAAVNIFLAYTLDGIDGKQARRTNSSGPLGELFDHGLDSYTAALIPITMYSIFGRGTRYSVKPYRMYYVFWNILINFYLSHWEKYNTGVLFLPWGYDFSMWGTIITFLIAGIWGHEVWQFALPGGITAGAIFESSLYISALATSLPVIFWNIYVSYRDRTGHMLSFYESIRPLLTLAMFMFLCTLWVTYSPANIVERDPRALYFMTGTTFSNISCRLIVAQMSNTRCELYNWLLLPTSIVVLFSLVIKNEYTELGLLYFLCLLATVAHLHYAVGVVQQMCRHFRIKCFTIKNHAD